MRQQIKEIRERQQDQDRKEREFEERYRLLMDEIEQEKN